MFFKKLLKQLNLSCKFWIQTLKVLVQISLKWDLFIKDNKKEHVKLIWNSSKNIQSNSNNNLNKSDYT